MRFIDMDGVIVNMLSVLERDTGVLHNNTGNMNYDLCPIHSDHLHSVDSSWWAELPAFPWARKLVRITDIILTRPWNHESAKGKAEWLKREFPANKFVISNIDKSYYAKNNILIDDNERLITEWEANGGIGILFPQSYNNSSMEIAEIINAQ